MPVPTANSYNNLLQTSVRSGRWAGRPGRRWRVLHGPVHRVPAALSGQQVSLLLARPAPPAACRRHVHCSFLIVGNFWVNLFYNSNLIVYHCFLISNWFEFLSLLISVEVHCVNSKFFYCNCRFAVHMRSFIYECLRSWLYIYPYN